MNKLLNKSQFYKECILKMIFNWNFTKLILHYQFSTIKFLRSKTSNGIP